MAICPLCENEQGSGDACEVCGRPHPVALGAARATPAIEGLEPTLFERVDAPALARIEDLEPTVLEPARDPASPDGAAPWLDRTAHPPAEGEALAPLEVEATALAVPERAEHDPFSLATCRYCHAAATPGDVFCGSCGMKLDAYRSSASTENRR